MVGKGKCSHVFAQIRKKLLHTLFDPPLLIYWGGLSRAVLYVLHLALFNPDVNADRKNNPEPWNKLGPNDQYKFYSASVDYSKLKKEGPDF
ncbi:unnamed protein product [Nyctereutes procyonoides]|uniref:Cytochrome c oxidase subunit NDUFA4 n=1 Tax=Nyctereutes procyonoides TaxID=34880 RepID=A0A811ZQP2_NYCPR|nr:unnamed protein product [Nyctereutes procyonoides]